MQLSKPATVSDCDAHIAHEINQPLAAILLNAESAMVWLMNEPPNFNAARKALGRVIGNGRRAGYVVESIRSMARKSSLGMDEIRVELLVSQLLDLHATTLGAHDIAVTLRAARRVPRIRGDRAQLERVVTNLLTNAVDAMKEIHGRQRTLDIVVRSDRAGGVRVSVADSGTGVERANAALLFEPGFTTKGEGMGLGLSICRSIIDSHAGRLWARPNRPHGTTFSFVVPTAGTRFRGANSRDAGAGAPPTSAAPLDGAKLCLCQARVLPRRVVHGASEIPLRIDG